MSKQIAIHSTDELDKYKNTILENLNKYWYYHPWGQVRVNEDGVTRWYTKEGGKMSFLIPKVDYETLRQTIDGLVLDTIL